MLHIKLITFGKLKEAYLRAACAEYEKRLGAFCKLEIVEFAPAMLADNPSQAQIKQALQAEAKLAFSAIPSQASVAALCVEGKQISSEQFSAWVERTQQASSCIALVIGSSYGLDDSVKQAASLQLSLSKMTFPHQLARVMLLEQLYRAFQISGGGKYHK